MTWGLAHCRTTSIVVSDCSGNRWCPAFSTCLRIIATTTCCAAFTISRWWYNGCRWVSVMMVYV